MLREVGFSGGFRVVYLFDSDATIKAHAMYYEAKAGDPEAALRLVRDLALRWLFVNDSWFQPGSIYVAPHAKEAGGDNAIPQTLASICATIFRGSVDREIVQTDRVYHTGADPMERMATRATFEGQVNASSNYVLVDDVTNMGGTLAELNNYILAAGGSVSGVLVLTNAGRNPELVPNPNHVRLIKERFQNEFIEIFGIKPEALTANEAGYLVGFRSIDELRGRLAKAEQEIDRRLRSKGISRSGGAEASL